MNLPPETLNMLPFGVLFVAPDLTVEFVNRWLAAQLDVSLETLLGRNLLEVFPEIGDANRSYAFRLVLDSGQPVTLAAALHGYLIRMEPPLETGSEYMPQDAHLLPVFGEDDSVEGILVFIYDRSRVMAQKRLLDEESRKTHLLQKIDRVLATLRLDECLRTVAEGMPELLKADSAVVLLRRGDELEVAACAGKCGNFEKSRFSIMVAAFGWVARTGVPLILDDVRREPHYRMADKDSRSFLGVPLVFQGRVNGVLAVESRSRAAFDAHSLEIMEMLAARASVAIQNALLYRQARQRRSYFERVLDQSTDVIFTLDTNLRITLVNAAWNTLARESGVVNWVGHRAVHRSVLEMIPPRYRAHWKRVLTQILEGEIEAHSEDVHWRLGARSYWLNVRLAPLRQQDGTIAGVVASARDITSAVLSRKRLEGINRQLNALVEAMQVLKVQVGPTSLLDASLNFLYRILNLSAVAFYAWEAEGKHFTLLASRGFSNVAQGQRLPPLESLPASSVKSFGAVSYLPDVRVWGAGIFQEQGVPALAARVFSRQGLAGAFLACFGRRVPTEEERELLEMFSIQFSVAWENVRTRSEHQRFAFADALTGLASPRQFEARLADVVERAARYSEAASLVVVDVDNFRAFNETFGYSAGDQVLQALAEVMRRNLRRSDFLARYGGEEIAIILPRTELREAYETAERLRKAVVERIPDLLADICRKAAPGTPPCENLTLSMGVAATPRHTVDPEALLEYAEFALCEAKRRGKNRVVPYWGVLEWGGQDSPCRAHLSGGGRTTFEETYD